MKELFKGIVYHERFGKKANRFRYPVFSIRFDIDKTEDLGSKYFSVNARNLFSFHDIDHGYRNQVPLRQWAEETLAKADIKGKMDKIILHTFPRVLGYVFNPVSFWYCYQNDQLAAIICEVNNTFGETHSYVIRNKVAQSKKVFHVSPFYSREGYYKFDFNDLENVKIDYHSGDQLLLKTGLSGKFQPLTDRALMQQFWKNPFFTFFVVLRIHWQALRLFSKRVRFHRKPTPIKQKVTSDQWPGIKLA